MLGAAPPGKEIGGQVGGAQRVGERAVARQRRQAQGFGRSAGACRRVGGEERIAAHGLELARAVRGVGEVLEHLGAEIGGGAVGGEGALEVPDLVRELAPAARHREHQARLLAGLGGGEPFGEHRVGGVDAVPAPEAGQAPEQACGATEPVRTQRGWCVGAELAQHALVCGELLQQPGHAIRIWHVVEGVELGIERRGLAGDGGPALPAQGGVGVAGLDRVGFGLRGVGQLAGSGGRGGTRPFRIGQREGAQGADAADGVLVLGALVQRDVQCADGLVDVVGAYAAAALQVEPRQGVVGARPDGARRRRVGGVDQAHGFGLAGDRLLERGVDVAGPAQGQQSGEVAQQRRELRRVDGALGVDRRPIQRGRFVEGRRGGRGMDEEGVGETRGRGQPGVGIRAGGGSREDAAIQGLGTFDVVAAVALRAFEQMTGEERGRLAPCFRVGVRAEAVGDLLQRGHRVCARIVRIPGAQAGEPGEGVVRFQGSSVAFVGSLH